MENNKRSGIFWVIAPLLLAIPVCAAALVVALGYGQLLQELVLAACKVVVVR